VDEDFVNFCERTKYLSISLVTSYPTDGFESDEETEVQLFKSQRGMMRNWPQDTRRRSGGKPVYTPNGTLPQIREIRFMMSHMPQPLRATIMEAKGLVEGTAFGPSRHLRRELLSLCAFHGRIGLLTLQGVPKPTYRAFELSIRWY